MKYEYERAMPDDSEFINFDHSKHIPPKGSKHIKRGLTQYYALVPFISLYL